MDLYESSLYDLGGLQQKGLSCLTATFSKALDND